MMSYLILFAFLAMIGYYGYSAFMIVKNFIQKKIAEKKASSNIDHIVHNVSESDEQIHGE